MTPHRRLRRIAKWVGTLTSTLIIAAWLMTAPILTNRMYAASLLSPNGEYQLRWGTLKLDWHESSPLFQIQESLWNSGWSTVGFSRADLSAYGLILPKVKWFARRGNVVPQMASFVIPIWVLLTVVLVPTVLLWRIDRPKPGHCRACNYNLTGNTSGICPECGTRLVPRLMGETRASP